MTDHSHTTPESLLASIRELRESRAETDRLMKENALLIRELRESQAETARQMKETAHQMKETDRKIKESQAETDRQLKETSRKLELTDRTIGSWANNQGFMAEEYFFNSFERGEQNFFGEKFDEIAKNIKTFKKNYVDQYDILLLNGKTVGIVEVKYKAHENDVPQVLRKAETFRVNFPEYAGHQVYLGLATMVFYPELEQLCIAEGIAVVKQVGEKVIINDEHLKAF